MITLLRENAAPQIPDQVCASQKTKRSILYDDNEAASSSATSHDPWVVGPDPWSQARLPAKPVHASAASTTTTSRLSQLEASLQQSVKDQVQRSIAAKTEVPTADPEQSKRIQRLEAGAHELQLQTAKFEGWFSSFGKQVADTGAQLEEVQQAVRSQQRDIQQIQGDLSKQADLVQATVRNAVGSTQQEVSTQLATQLSSQFEQITALLSKKARTE